MANRLTDPFQTGADVYFPSERSDWRAQIGDELDPDDELIVTPEDVVAVLGFDPAEEDGAQFAEHVRANQFAEFDESKVSRVGKGSSEGGQFGSGGGTATEKKPQGKNPTQTQKNAIEDYTTDKFQKINGALRGASEVTGDIVRDVKQIDAGLERMPSHEGEAFRAFSVTPDQFNEFAAMLQEGKVFSDKAYMSASGRTRGFSAKGKDKVSLVIKSTKGRDVSGLSKNPAEREVLFPRGTQFVVESFSIGNTGEIQAVLIDATGGSEPETVAQFAEFDESKVSREAKGAEGGGRFAGKGNQGATTPEQPRKRPEPESCRECSRLAIEALTGSKADNITRTFAETVFAIEDQGFQRDISPTKQWRGKTVRQLREASSGLTGLVSSPGHVMAITDGKLLNSAGHSEDAIMAVVQFTKEQVASRSPEGDDPEAPNA